MLDTLHSPIPFLFDPCFRICADPPSHNSPLLGPQARSIVSMEFTSLQFSASHIHIPRDNLTPSPAEHEQGDIQLLSPQCFPTASAIALDYRAPHPTTVLPIQLLCSPSDYCAPHPTTVLPIRLSPPPHTPSSNASLNQFAAASQMDETVLPGELSLSWPQSPLQLKRKVPRERRRVLPMDGY